MVDPKMEHQVMGWRLAQAPDDDEKNDASMDGKTPTQNDGQKQSAV